jgi:glucose/arabinose dehydrogenase
MQASLFGTAPLLRMMAIAPNGDIFASSTRTDQVLVMPDRDADGIADETITFAANLAKPHGLAFHDGYLYVACEAAVWRFPYAPGQLQANGDRQKIADVPYGPSQGLVQDVNHDTRSITFGPNNKMYVSVGSDCDLCADGNPDRATIFEFNDDGTNGRIYASGLRNAVGIDTDPRTGLLWASVNERNGSGSDIPPDLLTPIRSGGDYGWPYCLGIPLQPDPHFGMTGVFCAAKDTAPVALPAHSAPLGIRFYNGGGQLSKAFDYGIFLAMHGTAPRQGNNPPLREPAVGYDVSFVSLRPGKMAEGAQTVISGWLTNGEFWGRPVDLAFGHDGSMYISDDAGGAIYRLTFSVP